MSYNFTLNPSHFLFKASVHYGYLEYGHGGTRQQENIGLCLTRLLLLVSKLFCGYEKEDWAQRKTERERETETERDRDRERDRETETEREEGRGRQREKERERKKKRANENNEQMNERNEKIGTFIFNFLDLRNISKPLGVALQ